MGQLLRSGVLSACFLSTLLAQGANRDDVFDVASLKLARPVVDGPVFHGCRGGPGAPDSTILICQNLSLATLIAQAYGIDEDRIVTPAWTRSVLFDLSARVPPGTSAVSFRTMQQNLLVERVHLAVHMETKVIRGYELSIDRGGLKLEIAKRVDPEQSAVRPVRPNPRAIDQNGFPLPDTPGYVNIAGHAKYFSPSMTMKQFALMLHNHLGAPVSDATGLSGEYEIRLLWIMQATRQPDSAWSDSVPELQQALQRQLGLRLDEVKVKADVLVIDQVDRTPVAN